MKKQLAFLLFLLCICGLSGCGSTAAPETNEPDVTIDYGTSDLYTQADMDAAIQLIEDEFRTWDGCELHSITYGSDDACTDEALAWLNEMRSDDSEPFTQCILFLSDFHSPVNGGDAWEADTEYTDWQWWLARTDGGNWNLLTWGY